MKRITLVSDYTPLYAANEVTFIQDDQGDVHISLYRGHETERGVRIAASGTRYSHEVRKAFYDLIEALGKEKADE